jgi:hypothetical protein
MMILALVLVVRVGMMGVGPGFVGDSKGVADSVAWTAVDMVSEKWSKVPPPSFGVDVSSIGVENLEDICDRFVGWGSFNGRDSWMGETLDERLHSCRHDGWGVV